MSADPVRRDAERQRAALSAARTAAKLILASRHGDEYAVLVEEFRQQYLQEIR